MPAKNSIPDRDKKERRWSEMERKERKRELLVAKEGKIVRKGIKEKSWKKSFECRICV